MIAEDRSLKLLDFGSALEAHEKDTVIHPGKLRGTPAYLGPECWLDSYSTASDIWALGIMLCKMLFFRTPFKSETRDELKEEVLTVLREEATGGHTFLNQL